MITISDTLRANLSTDNVPKHLRVYLYLCDGTTGPYPAEDRYPAEDDYPDNILEDSPDFVLDDNSVIEESLKLKEGVCTDDDLNLASCYSGSLEMQATGVTSAARDMAMVAKLVVEGETLVLFRGTVYSVKRKTGSEMRTLTAYDYLYGAGDVDALAMLQSTVYPTTLRAIAERACTLAGLKLDETANPADELEVEAVDDWPSSVTVRQLLGWYAELNGRLLRQNRDGVITLVALPDYTANYPAEDIYPAEDYCPGLLRTVDDVAPWAMSCSHADYYTDEIEGVILQDYDGNVRGGYGDQEGNVYIVADNLLAGMLTADSVDDAGTVLGQEIYPLRYVSHDSEMLGMPWLEPGDAVDLPISPTETMTALILERTLSGIVSLHDAISANGSEGDTPTGDAALQLALAKARALEEAIKDTIVSVEVQYAQGASDTEAPEDEEGWSTTAPMRVSGMYIWQRTVTTYKDGSTSVSDAACISGADGADGSDGSDGSSGVGIANIVRYYLVSDQATGVTIDG